MTEAEADTAPSGTGQDGCAPAATTAHTSGIPGVRSRGEPRVRRILTVDGGGIRGIFPAAFLAEFEKDLEYPIARYFDLIAGTSTGGIIALGLALGVSAADLTALYEKEGPSIFGQTRSGLWGLLAKGRLLGRWLWRPKYDADELRKAVNGALGKQRLADATTRLVIPAWHPQTQRAYLFKTAHHPRFETDYKELALDVAMATASPPSYFSEHRTTGGVGLVDGGLWANNPAAVAVVEAVGILGWPADQIRVLSIGCLDEVPDTKKRYGVLRLARRLHGFFLRGQSQGSLGIASALTGHPHTHQAIYRVSQPVPEGRFSLDDTGRSHDLIDRAVAEARQQKPTIKAEFLSEPTEPFQPYHGR